MSVVAAGGKQPTVTEPKPGEHLLCPSQRSSDSLERVELYQQQGRLVKYSRNQAWHSLYRLAVAYSASGALQQSHL